VFANVEKLLSKVNEKIIGTKTNQLNYITHANKQKKIQKIPNTVTQVIECLSSKKETKNPNEKTI
jgi:hypothetical protein